MNGKRKRRESKYGSFYTIPFTRSRDIVVDFISIGKKTMKVHALGEIDVTIPLLKIEEYKAKGIKLSFSAFIMYVLAHTVAEHPYMQAIKWRRRRMVIFEDVDVSFIVEREVSGKKMPTAVMIRNANRKSIQELTDDLWSGRAKSDDSMVDKDKEGGSDIDKLLRMPRFLRRFLMWRIYKNPFLHRKFNGTTGITSVGMFAKGGGTAIPIATGNFSITVGGIDKRPGYFVKEDGELDLNQIVPRDFLWLTINIDHTTVDGGPATRFLAIFRERLRLGYGLDNLESKKEKKAKEP
ncbi:MAG: 2-oxo acid dehydrogenase subunit E2 [Asgard group archaeon]|nr:2-oxo acid dehydrogenase subunit E2 [Asgard group archaeon]